MVSALRLDEVDTLRHDADDDPGWWDELIGPGEAYAIDTQGVPEAQLWISKIKAHVPNVALDVIDDAIQMHGAAGLSDDFPLARMYAGLRTLRFADGPDAVHRMAIARTELKRYWNR